MFRDEVEELLHEDEADGPFSRPEDVDRFGRRMSWEGIEDALSAMDEYDLDALLRDEG